MDFELIGILLSGALLGAGCTSSFLWRALSHKKHTYDTLFRDYVILEAEKKNLQVALEKISEEARAREEKESHVMLHAKAALEKVAQSAFSQAFEQSQQRFFSLTQQTLGAFQGVLSQDHHTQKTHLSTLVTPLVKALEVMDERIREMETTRKGAYEGLREQLGHLAKMNDHLRQETGKLAQAMKHPQTRGRWGEVQLRRVIELAGMVAYCDFVEQEAVIETSLSGREGLRPDVVIKLPEKREIIVDAKVPLTSYLEALEAMDENTRKTKWKAHAQQLRKHVMSLSKKGYAHHKSADFVILFSPHDAFLTAALEQDAEILEFAARAHIMLATPMTLIALLRVIAFGWSQVSVIEQASTLHRCGQDLSKHLESLMGLWGLMGKQLGSVVQTYNKAIQEANDHVGGVLHHFQNLGLTVKAATPLHPVISKPVCWETSTSYGESFSQETAQKAP